MRAFVTRPQNSSRLGFLPIERSRLFRPDASKHSLYRIKLCQPGTSYPEENFGGNQLLDGLISLSPLHPSLIARQNCCRPPSEFPLASPCSGIVHHLSGQRCARSLAAGSRPGPGKCARGPAWPGALAHTSLGTAPGLAPWVESPD